MRFAFMTFAACAAMLGIQAPAGAAQLYATDFLGTGVDSSFYSVDVSTGAATPVNPGPGRSIGDLASNAAAGIVWGVDIAAQRLYTLDRATGAATAGPAITQPGNVLPIVSIAYDPVRGKIFGNSAVGFGITSNDALFEINPATGAATLIGAIGFDRVYALGYADGKLYGVSDSRDEFISIDPILGAGTRIATLAVGFYFDLAQNPGDGRLYLASSGDYKLYTIDAATGALTAVGPFGGTPNIAGLAFVSEVPEPSTYVLMLAGLLGLGFMARRRR